MNVVIFVLDDEPWNLSWLEDYAASLGAEVHFSSAYEDAVRFLAGKMPDIVVIDIMIGAVEGDPEGASLQALPKDWYGLRLLRHIRAERKWTKNQVAAIVYTGLDREELAKTVENAFQARFCTKYDPEDFRLALAREIKARADRKSGK